MAKVTIVNLRMQAESMHIPIIERKLSADYMGMYIKMHKTIVIDPTLSQAQYLCTLYHELVHAKYDDQSCGISTNSGTKNEVRARKLTAIGLINDLEYKTVECLYDGNIFSMAAEIGVTPAVLLDYQHVKRGERIV